MSTVCTHSLTHSHSEWIDIKKKSHLPTLVLPTNESLFSSSAVTPPTYNINPSPPFSVLPSELDMPSEPGMPPEPLELSLVVPPMPTPQDAPPPPQSSLSEQRSSNSATKRPSPPVDEITANKRQRNNEAARKYRQKRIDRISELETELTGVKQERDDLRIRLARQEAEAAALRSMLQLKSTAAESGKDSKG